MDTGILGSDVGYGAAALAGLASFLTPCILPIVPFYLCYISGISFGDLTAQDRRTVFVPLPRVVLSSVLFAIGMTIVFVGMGAAATAFGQQIRAHSAELRWLAAALIFAVGLHYIGLLRIPALLREAKLDLGDRPRHTFGSIAGPVLIGMAFAFGWSPCAGPILAIILYMAADAQSVTTGAALLGAYAAGMTLPFVLAALFVGPFVTWAVGLRRHMGAIEKGIGLCLVCFALLVGSNSVNTIAGWMMAIAPDWGLAQ